MGEVQRGGVAHRRRSPDALGGLHQLTYVRNVRNERSLRFEGSERPDLKSAD